jgi:hypothetical protein
MPFVSTKAIRTSSRLVLAVSIWVIFTSGNVCAFSLLSLIPSEDSFALGQWQGGVIGGYEWEDQQTTAQGISSGVMRNRFDEDVHLSNEGFYLIDPRLFEGNAGTDVDFFQESDKLNGTGKSQSSTHRSQSGTLIGWNVNTELLGAMPYSGFLFSRRNETDTSTDFGGRTHNLSQNFGMLATLRQDSFLREAFPYFSADVYARQEEADESTTQLGQTFKIDETRDIGGVDAYKGFQTADLDFNYQFIDDKYTGSIPYSFVTNWLNLNYSLDFGPTLNRRWESRVSYLTRSGGGLSESFLYADERLRIDHFKNLFTTYEYLLVSTGSQGQRDTSNTATFQVQYSAFPNLTNTLILQGFYETISPGGYLDYYAVETSPAYTHSIPWGGTLTLGTDGRYEIDQDHTQGPVTVLNEKHTAPSFFGPGIGFTLANRFVVTSTIVMYDTHGGGRLLTRLGVDYDLVAQGQLTQIVIIPTTVKIHPGDPLEVSYSYVAGPSGQYSTTVFGANAGVAFGWIALNFSHQQLKQSLQNGIGAQYLYSFHQENAQLDVHKEWEWFEARGMALYQIYHTQSQASGAFDYTLQNYGEFLTFRPPWTWSTNTAIHLDGSETFIDYTLQPTRQNTDLNFEASLDRFFSSGNYFTAFARARQITQTDFQTETDYEVGMRGNFRYGKIYIWPWLSWIERTYGPTKVNDPHIMLRIGRDL